MKQDKIYLTISAICFGISVVLLCLLFQGCTTAQRVSYNRLNCIDYALMTGKVYEHIHGKPAIVCTEKRVPTELGHVQAGFIENEIVEWLRLNLERGGINPPGYLDIKDVPCELKMIYECMPLSEFERRVTGWRIK